jgi:hypothetical protein
MREGDKSESVGCGGARASTKHGVHDHEADIWRLGRQDATASAADYAYRLSAQSPGPAQRHVKRRGIDNPRRSELRAVRRLLTSTSPLRMPVAVGEVADFRPGRVQLYPLRVLGFFASVRCHSVSALSVDVTRERSASGVRRSQHGPGGRWQSQADVSPFQPFRVAWLCNAGSMYRASQAYPVPASRTQQSHS